MIQQIPRFGAAIVIVASAAGKPFNSPFMHTYLLILPNLACVRSFFRLYRCGTIIGGYLWTIYSCELPPLL